ncbi:kelch repeat-containing protein [Archangium gephyra]|uniref:kelch repeat-containing protein n=1 Tax=Archangium gephyra TaxID=48 RepID=UPI0035D4234D
MRSKRSIPGIGLTYSLLAVFAFIVASCSGVQPPEAEQFGQSEAALDTGWQATTPMPEQRRLHTATVLASDKVLVVGGWSYNSLLANAVTYDPATATWPPAGVLTLAREAHTATRLSSGKVLVAGGETLNPPTGYTNTAELYDPATNSWSPAGAMGQARGYNTATLLPANPVLSLPERVLVVGGLNGPPLDAVDLYNAATNTWSSVAPLLEPRRSHAAVRLASGKVLVTGGWGGWPLGPMATTELYDPSTNTWIAGPSLSRARYGHTSTELPSGKILVVGGQTADSPPGTVSFAASAELYDPSTNTWTSAGTLTGARGFHTATLVAGRVIVAGGRGVGNVALATVEVYDPSTNSWSTTNPMAGARSDHAAVYSNPLGKLLVLGGSNEANAPITTAELYNADPCASVTCNTPPSQCHLATGTCSNGTCSYAPKSADSPCNDGNACTTGDTCDGAGACAGTALSCSTASSTYCSGNDVRKTTGTGTCSGGACGSTDSFVQTCPTGTSGLYCSGSGAYQTVYGGCVNGACASTQQLVEACSSGSSTYCSGNNVRKTTGTGCSGGACGSTDSFVQTCPTGTSGPYCSGNSVYQTVYGGCSGGSCSSSGQFLQNCPTSTTYGAWSACVAYDCGGSGTQSRSVTEYGCFNGACSASTWTDTQSCSTPPVTCPTGTSGPYCSGNSVYQTVYGGCSGGSCSSSEQFLQNCPTDTTYGAWSACVANGCGGSGTQSRSVTEYGCFNGACSASTWTDTQSCSTPPVTCPTGTSAPYCSGNSVYQTVYGGCSGGSCSSSEQLLQTCPAGTTYGAWSACVADGCGGSGTQSRDVTYYGCNGGACSSSVYSYTETQSCSTPPVTCPTGTSAPYCSGNSVYQTVYGGCSGGSCSSSEQLIQNCPSDQTCSGGACTTPCPGGQTSCNGQCVDTSSDRNNCGSCGHSCINFKFVCIAGQCEYF